MAKAPRIPRTDADLKTEFIDQVGLLRMACESYDKGHHAAGKHIGLVLRVLLHNRGQSRALLDQIKLLSKLFLDTAGHIEPGNILADMPMISMRIGAGNASYLAKINTPVPFNLKDRKLGFIPWWNNTILRLADGSEFSRKSLVLHVTDTDGGAHVDPELDKAYMALSRQNGLGWLASDASGSQRFFDGRPELAHMRQIAHEFLASISESYPEYSLISRPVLPTFL